jgi:hypothetical protein
MIPPHFSFRNNSRRIELHGRWAINNCSTVLVLLLVIVDILTFIHYAIDNPLDACATILSRVNVILLFYATGRFELSARGSIRRCRARVAIFLFNTTLTVYIAWKIGAVLPFDFSVLIWAMTAGAAVCGSAMLFYNVNNAASYPERTPTNETDRRSTGSGLVEHQRVMEDMSTRVRGRSGSRSPQRPLRWRDLQPHRRYTGTGEMPSEPVIPDPSLQLFTSPLADVHLEDNEITVELSFLGWTAGASSPTYSPDGGPSSPPSPTYEPVSALWSGVTTHHRQRDSTVQTHAQDDDISVSRLNNPGSSEID